MISALVAYTKEKRVIGKNGKIPWNLPSERDRFKKICNSKKIIMGRKSFEEIGHALPYCTIIILSSTLTEVPEGCLLARTPMDAIKMTHDVGCDAGAADCQEVLVCGGEEVYKAFLPYITKVYATEIDSDFDGDTFFPELPPKKDGCWQKTLEETKSEKGISYDYVSYEFKVVDLWRKIKECMA